MMSSIEVNCENMIVFSPSPRSLTACTSSRILRIFADEGGSSEPVSRLLLDFRYRASQSEQQDASFPIFLEVIL